VSGIVMALGAGAAGLCVVGFAVLAVLAVRALRRNADFEAEMRAPSFSFKVRVRPQTHRDD
jgi:biopolymer transport protein ExbB/TolQ